MVIFRRRSTRTPSIGRRDLLRHSQVRRNRSLQDFRGGPARLLLTYPDRLRDSDTQLVQELTAACPELAELARHVRSFAEFLTPADGNDAKLTAWITTVRAADLPHLHGFANGIELDRDAVTAALTLPHHNGRTEGVNTRTKRIMRQMHGRAGFELLRRRILLQ
ncbi:transposase [Nonomuraea polychroma]|uniref:transposase n=1 Tax=Nonomuraea polychroma TaxID=46176 RepID=UPI003D89DA29